VGGSEGTAAGEFLEPIGVDTSPAGQVYVVDDQRNDIQVFDGRGLFIRTLGGPGSGPGQLADTGNVRVREDGLVVNADFGNGRVQAWDAEGAFQWSLGSQGTGPGEFDEPQDVAFGPDGMLFVVDDARVQVFDSRRQLIGTWPEEPSPDHLGSLALIGDVLWVAAPYSDTLFQVR
jgi:DNA-binding beta-propeller fold protein YncE